MGRVWLFSLVAIYVSGFTVVSWCEDAEVVTVCKLKNDPPAYNHKLIQVEAFVSHDFEDFTLFGPECASWPAVWLEYGGKFKSDTTYCCGPTNGKSRPHELIVEDIPVPLIEDDQFRSFDKQIQPPFRSGKYGSIVHATIVGRFFAGKKVTYPNGTSAWAGFGHMGCCSLFAIQEIKSVSPQDRDDLDYGASDDQPDFGKAGCGYRSLTPIEPGGDAVHAQQKADRDPKSEAFDDPEFVATGFLKTLLKLDPQRPLNLAEKRKSQGRIVYEWSKTGKPETYMIVVSRPYLLSFYANDPSRVAWVVVAAYASSCESNHSNSVVRIK